MYRLEQKGLKPTGRVALVSHPLTMLKCQSERGGLSPLHSNRDAECQDHLVSGTGCR